MSLPHRRHAEESGVASAELVLAMPVLLFVLMLVVQFGLWYHGAHVATAAAQEGARTARAEGGTGQAGEARTRDFLAELGREVVTAPEVSAIRGPDQSRVEVRGYAVAVVPGLRLPIHAVSAASVERFRASTEP